MADQAEITDVKEQLAELGVDITGRKVRARLRRAEAQAQHETDKKFKVVTKAQITERIQSMLAFLAVFFVAGFLVFGNIAVTIMFPFAEYTAVRRGIMAFEAHAFIASFNAATIVIGYVVLLFVKCAMRDNLNGHKGKSVTAILFRNIKWTIMFIQVSIVLFGFLGRTADNLISGAPIGVVEFIGYSGTIILTIALLAVTDITVLFIYSIFVNNVGVLNLAGGDEKHMLSFLEERKEVLKLEALNDILIMEKQKSNLTE
jgi:hypothetical protein